MRNKRYHTYVAVLLLLLGIGFILLGVKRGEHKVVEKKSNLICLECVGIG